MSLILQSSEAIGEFQRQGGGKATNMARLSQHGFSVPAWFCISSRAFEQFVEANKLGPLLRFPTDQAVGELAALSATIEKRFIDAQMPWALEQSIGDGLRSLNLMERFVAVRSSGLDEDSAENSFAGQFSSYLFQQGLSAVLDSVKKCWASGFSERALAYRIERGLPLSNIQVGVVIQQMVNADVAGVAFSRDPVRPLERDSLIVSSVWGLGEGLVSGELDADHFVCDRKKLSFKPTVVEKSHAFRQAPQGGLIKTEVTGSDVAKSSLTDGQVAEVARLALELERKIGSPQDCEWAIEGDMLYCVQTRPITSLPPEVFFDPSVTGRGAILWDNSNIIESYSGVTSPLTFSFASAAYRQVYIQFCEVVGVSQKTIEANESMFRNMLGQLRGRIYYNLINWYRLVLMLPGSSSNKGFMDTMMGVRGNLKPEHAKIFDFIHELPTHSLPRKIWGTWMTVWRFIRIDSIVWSFQKHFSEVYEEARKTDFSKLPLDELQAKYHSLDEQILRRWHAPIINDYLCMIFFGLLKKFTEKWLAEGDSATAAASAGSLQNDLLCGQGDLESTEPTKALMRIAKAIDLGPGDIKEWFLSTSPADAWAELKRGEGSPKILAGFEDFLDRYGFRCVNELKLEEPDLHDDPGFVISAVASYVKMKSYSIEAMAEREQKIRVDAEAQVRAKLRGPKLSVYFWILKQARRAVKNRENLRFARTKIFGVIRHLFRAMGGHFSRLGVFADAHDIFYLTVEEIFAFNEGRAVSTELKGLIEIRKVEYQEYRDTPPPPDRLITFGSAGVSCGFTQVLSDSDLLRSELPVSTDPNVLVGTPCCPGIVEGVVRVAHSLKDAEAMNGEILVTGRTDPGWVPLYPSCSGLLIERGSLLSHSAVVARELGLPTIVGISGGLMTKLKTGQRVRVDAAKGEVRILE